MHSIFFDLETSDRDCIGQILNYSFIVVDEKFTILEECSGTVAFTPLQVPSLGALLANRIRVLEHNVQSDKNMRSERDAMLHIDAFLMRITKLGQVALVGFNSFRFDVPFLRTVLIRNGIKPYYRGLVYKDLYSAVQFLGCTDPRFKAPQITSENGEPGTFSLSLENVTKSLGLLRGAQIHESRDDVLLEIALAEYLQKHFGLHIADWDPYRAHFTHSEPRGALFHQIFFDRDTGTSKRSPVLLFDVDRRNSLWLDLKRFEEQKRAWTLGKISGGQLFITPFEAGDMQERERLAPLISVALDKNREMTLHKYFERKSECDIEQDIYRLDIAHIDRLHRALYDGDERAVREAKSRDLSTLLTRAKLATGDSAVIGFAKTLHRYGQHRYGGELLLSRYRGGEKPRFSTTREQLLKEVNKPFEDLGDEEIRRQLKEFYNHAAVLNWPLILQH